MRDCIGITEKRKRNCQTRLKHTILLFDQRCMRAACARHARGVLTTVEAPGGMMTREEKSCTKKKNETST